MHKYQAIYCSCVQSLVADLIFKASSIDICVMCHFTEPPGVHQPVSTLSVQSSVLVSPGFIMAQMCT